MMPAQARLFVQREISLSLRSRWFVAYVLVFMLGGACLATFGLGDTVVYGYRGFAQAIAGLAHLALLFVPLMALVPAVATITDDRETGALEYLLAQPVTAGEVYIGKWLGVALAVILSITIGFGTAGVVAALRGVSAALVGAILVFILLIAMVFVGLGTLLAAVVRTRGRATTLGIVCWLALVSLGTLGIMAAFIRWGLPPAVLVAWSFVNPVEVFRLGIISLLDPDMSVLGPVGSVIITRLGPAGIGALSAVVLAAWSAALAGFGWWRFRTPRS
jgi:ABC-type transport system involved in multi-copper enzyme maturation permease subunit